MTDKDPSVIIRFISRDVDVSDFLIRPVVHEGIWYFSLKQKMSV